MVGCLGSSQLHLLPPPPPKISVHPQTQTFELKSKNQFGPVSGEFVKHYRTSFSYTARKFLNSWPNSLHWLAVTRLQGQLETRFMSPKNSILLAFTQQNTFALTLH